MQWFIGSNGAAVHWISYTVFHWLTGLCRGFVTMGEPSETFCRRLQDPANKMINRFLRIHIVLK